MRVLTYCAALAAGMLAFVSGPRLDGVTQAEACGGCFVPPPHEGAEESTVVTGHRMAMAISMDETVLWDQIEYSGDPEEFSWVLPIKPGAVLEVASDAWFDVLDAATGTVVGEPVVFCDDGGFEGGGSSFGCGCSSADSAGGGDGDTVVPPEPEDVQVVSQGTVGPYETVTLSTDVPGALNDWLDDNGYQTPPEIQPTIDAYIEEGFDFIALKLAPNQGTGAMKPVRIRTPGASFVLPLRMVAAGTGPQTAMTLFVIAEGDHGVNNFAQNRVATNNLVWDFATGSSNYSELRLDALATDGGRTWIKTYARGDAFFNEIIDDLDGVSTVTYNSGGGPLNTIAEAYFAQGQANGEADPTAACRTAWRDNGAYLKVVGEACGDNGNCFDPDPGPGEISYLDYVCMGLDDLAVAMIGKHTRDVWITRLEANLPRAALDEDLQLGPRFGGEVVPNRHLPFVFENECQGDQADASPAALGPPRKKKRKLPAPLVLLTLSGVGLVWWARRRTRD